MSRRSSNGIEENKLWANPCDYKDSDSKSAVKYSPKLAKEVASQAKNAVTSTSAYKDEFASKLHSYPSFDELIQEWNDYEWLRKFAWYKEEVLPKEKQLNKALPDEHIASVTENIDEILPSMYKGLKMVVAGLYAINKEGFSEIFKSDTSISENIAKSMHDVRGVLCLFHDIMTSRNLEIFPLLDSEIPNFQNEDKLSIALLVYRDTINYLEYLSQVFSKMYETEEAA